MSTGFGKTRRATRLQEDNEKTNPPIPQDGDQQDEVTKNISIMDSAEKPRISVIQSDNRYKKRKG